MNRLIRNSLRDIERKHQNGLVKDVFENWGTVVLKDDRCVLGIPKRPVRICVNIGVGVSAREKLTCECGRVIREACPMGNVQ